MKNSSMSLSFSYVAAKSRKRSDGVSELLELDVFEISIVPHPANADTRVIEMKGLRDDLEYERLKRRTRDEIFAYLGASDGGGGDRLRERAQRIARAHAPSRSGPSNADQGATSNAAWFV